jgi:hypothetical protein
MEISSVTLSALRTARVPPELLTLPPVATARANDRNLTRPVTPSMSPETPSIAIVAPSGLDSVVRCGLSKRAEKVMEPARSAVRRIAITWSGALARTSRWYLTPFCRYDTELVAVVRSRCRLYSETPVPLGKVSRRSPTVWYASWPAGRPRMAWSTSDCAWLHWLAKTRRRISASAAAPCALLES